MHFAFIPYGIYHDVEYLKTQLVAQKFPLYLYNEKGERGPDIIMQGRLCLSIGGIWEYCFPKEYLDKVLATLEVHENINGPECYHINPIYLKILRKILHLKPYPKEFDTSVNIGWFKHNISIIPIGIREDGEITEGEGPYKGWIHERI